MRIIYTDQNNNVYTVFADELSYDPISESESSSGVYSGGDPAKVAIETSEYEEILQIAEQIANDSEGKSEVREMRTSVLTLVDNRESNSYILKPSESRIRFEELLQKFYI